MRLNIEAERARKRLTKEELAKTLDISVKTYYNWINGDTDIPGSALLKMAKLFGTSIEYLLEETEKEVV
ncbi:MULTISPECIES: helix-turn-helix transcriptional regulator [unclassified Lactonifactor]|uniref:helix-turn-helix domain-containing protein n=1 Tax=unclassified Lactonifactor TaxID=2636670 RepID=UPI0015643A1A|nr:MULTISPECIES: helix-turn-helix transcriptional regulator [unclassified Lactonifactor]